jgi:hypothetical protein
MGTTVVTSVPGRLEDGSLVACCGLQTRSPRLR